MEGILRFFLATNIFILVGQHPQNDPTHSCQNSSQGLEALAWHGPAIHCEPKSKLLFLLFNSMNGLSNANYRISTCENKGRQPRCL
ncbi:hypothetical protein GmHk_02G004182 [Glycine max]|nr:hypothetical protein GmHk_02G004182 [Glycine max]